MAKWQNDLMLDAALGYVKTNAANLCLCDSQPADFTTATTNADSGGTKLAIVAAVDADFIIGDGDFSGRKLIIPQKADVTIDSTGDATHVAIVSGSELLYVTTCVTQSLSIGNLVTIPSWDIELRDAV